jgi:hypothetical protein
MPDFSQKPPPKRTLIVPQPEMKAVIVHPKADIARLLDDGLSIFQNEILKLKVRSNNSPTGTLTPTDANVLQGYMKSLVGMAKEVREAEQKKSDELESMSPEDMLAAMEAEVARLKTELKK